MKILLIEDESILLDKLHSYLKKNGHTVEPTSDGQEGLDCFLADPSTFDLILCDIRMPVMDGLTLLKKIRRKEFLVPVVFMTGHGELALSIEALKLGAFDFILKPFRYRVLKETLARLQMFQSPREALNSILPQVNLQAEIPMQSQTHLVSAMVQYLNSLFEPLCRVHNIEIYGLSLCLMEALTNAVVHGNLGVSSQLKEKNIEEYEALIHTRESQAEFFQKVVLIRVHFTPDQFIFEIEDEGPGFNWKERPSHNPWDLLEHGRGIIIIKNMMDDISWNEAGNCIRIVKNIRGTE